MKEMKYKLPNDAESVTVKVEDGYVVALYEPKKELKFGDFVRLNKSGNTGIIQTKKKIQKFLDDNNLVIDYEKKKIVKKRWRAEKQETFYYISEYGIVLSAVETLKTCDDCIYKYGNYFRTKEQAEKVAKEVREVFEKHKND